MSEIPAAPILLIGIGNELRGDDALGRLVARRFSNVPGVRVVEENGEGVDLIAAWAGAQRVILVDAVESGLPPGTLHRFDATAAPIPATLFRCSTHAFSVAEAVELARVLGELPPRLILYGIEGRNFTAGSDLSPEVAGAIESAVEEIQREIQQTTGDPHARVLIDP
jgi:hydrogenase maturation protease